MSVGWDTLGGDRLFNSPAVGNLGRRASETDPFCQKTLNIQAIACYLP
ncbi:hypothetical protein [Laspinema olomoucense]|nr:hypothetical protein [Laspinema sp. D3a]MCT7989930.1 hypothetical protein [Laspinema sp. D3a]